MSRNVRPIYQTEHNASVCVRCGSSNTWVNFPRMGCNDCGYVWDIDDEEATHD